MRPAADKQRAVLLSYIGDREDHGAGMQVDLPAKKAAATPASASASRPGTPASVAAGASRKAAADEFIPEIDVYLTLLVIVFLLDQKQTEKVGPAHL